MYVTGLTEMHHAVERMSDDAKAALLKVQEAAASRVVLDAKRKVPTGTGAARRSVKVVYWRGEPRVTSDLVYFSWLDWGGNNSRWQSGAGMKRVWKREGRYIYPAYRAAHDDILVMMGEALITLCDDSGLEVT